MKFVAGVITLILSFGLTPGAEATSSSEAARISSIKEFVIDQQKSAMYLLSECLTETQLDCIESFGFYAGSGTKKRLVEGKQVFSKPDRYRALPLYESYGGNTKWQVKSKGESLKFLVSVSVTTPNYTSGGREQLERLRIYVRLNDWNVQHSKEVQVKVRTSWFKGKTIEMEAGKANWEAEELSGGTLWTFSGTPYNYRFSDESIDRDDLRVGAKASSSYSNTFVAQVISHKSLKVTTTRSNPTNSSSLSAQKIVREVQCFQSGYHFLAKDFNYVLSNVNTSEAFFYWNDNQQALEETIYAFARNSKGKKVFGSIRLQLSQSVLSCAWPDTKIGRSNIASFDVTILDEKGNSVPGRIEKTFVDGILDVKITKLPLGNTVLRISPVLNY